MTKRHVIEIKKFERTLGDEHRTCFIFDNCKFENNFQITIIDGNHIISVKSCEMRGNIPLILCKNAGVDVKLTNLNFDIPILFNKNSYVEIQHTGCNFTCPLFKGKEENTLVYTKDNYQSPQIDNLKMYSSPYEFTENKSNQISQGSQLTQLIEILSGEGKGSERDTRDLISAIESLKIIIDNDREERENFGGIELDSTMPMFRFLKVHKYTKFIRIKGNNSVTLVLPKDPINGHLLEIYTDAVVIIDDIEYHNKLIRIRWTVNGGYFFYPTDLKSKTTEITKMIDDY